MCIDCARRKIRDLRAAHPPPASGWFMCLVDHDDHVHFRLNLDGNQPSEWSQCPVTRGQFEQTLPRGTRLHVHEREAKKRGCDESVIDSIKTVTWDRDSSAASDDDVCAVCYDAFVAGDTVAVLPCAHLYHMGCVRPWFTKASTCPACRAEVTAEAVAAQAANSTALDRPQLAGSAPAPTGTTTGVHVDTSSAATASCSSEGGGTQMEGRAQDARIRTRPFPTEFSARARADGTVPRPRAGRSKWRIRRPPAPDPHT